MEIKRYARMFYRAAMNRFAVYASSRVDLVAFLFGKFIRMGFFVLLVFSLFDHAPSIAGYGEGQVLVFFAVMNLMDVMTQMIWYRGMYQLKDWILRGRFDSFLIQPISPLFKMAAMQLDLFDLITLPVSIGFVVFAVLRLPSVPDAVTILLACFLACCSLVLAFSINLCIASLSFWTRETEGAWAMYRDSIYVARFPPEIFPAALRLIFTFIIPILAIVVLPTKMLLGLFSPIVVWWGVALAVGWLVIALCLWRAGLRRYTSAGG